jgi:hypothetical protein
MTIDGTPDTPWAALTGPDRRHLHRTSLLGAPLQLPTSSAIDRRLDLGSVASLAGMQALELLERRAKRSSS